MRPRTRAVLDGCAAVIVLSVCALAASCVPHRQWNVDPSEYVRELEVATADGGTADLAVIEFDDHGEYWDEAQLEAALELIARRNAEHPDGVAVTLIVHGWKQNADPSREEGAFARFRASLGQLSERLGRVGGDGRPDHVVGVFLSWRGDTVSAPLVGQLTFWARLDGAERVAELDMQEALLALMRAAKANDRSRVYVFGHSMGGLIVARTLAPVMATLALYHGESGFRAPADLVVLLNPALDALSSARFLRFLERNAVRTEEVLLDSEGPSAGRPGGPLIVSITSKADEATKSSYALGRSLNQFGRAFRPGARPGEPSQRYLATRAEGHVEALWSHEAWVEDGEVRLAAIEGARNRSPFWVVSVTGDIVPDHSTFSRPEFTELVRLVQEEAGLFDTGSQTWVYTTPRGAALSADDGVDGDR